jgi:putative endonuclease
MFYTYVLYSKKSKRLYTGFTSNLKRRLLEHNGKQGGVYSKKNAPFSLIFYEAFLAKQDAIDQEKFYKSDTEEKFLMVK